MSDTQQQQTAKRNKRNDAYIARIVVPLDMANAQSLADAMAIIAKAKDELPTGTTVEARIGKIEAA